VKQTLHLVIRGRVQGVFFRDSMRREAQRLELAGWVRNCGDGSVEAMVHGEEDKVHALVRWSHRGPELAQVDQVEIEAGNGEFARFEII
jgi:acylphosphatase